VGDGDLKGRGAEGTNQNDRVVARGLREDFLSALDAVEYRLGLDGNLLEEPQQDLSHNGQQTLLGK